MQQTEFGYTLIKNRLGLTMPITFEKGGKGFEISKSGEGVHIRYESKRDCFRALTYAKQVYNTGEVIAQSAQFDMLCYMADMSRNAVMNMRAVKELITDLAMMGYSSMMLYIEDTYEVPESPYFGHMRGRYTKAQLKEIDKLGQKLGIEVIPCMQTLAHLATMLRWSYFRDIRDTDSIMLAGSEKTYELIDNMLKSLSECFTSKKIHLGMDEAHSLGLGKYLDKNGYHTRFEILSEHLKRVKEICDRYGFEPMIWSDMYFSIHTGGNYYMSEGELPPEIVEQVPGGVTPVYWDYCSTDVKVLDCMFKNHAKFSERTVFAGGAWKWSGFAPHLRVSHDCANVQIDACLRNGCKDIIVTGWGDNGCESSQFSVLPCLSLYAERCFDRSLYRDKDKAGSDDRDFAKRFQDCFDIPLEAFFLLDLPNEIFERPVAQHANPCKYALYNAVLGGIMDMHIPKGAGKKYADYARRLERYAEHYRFGYIFRTLAALCNVLEFKAEASSKIRDAYNCDDKAVLSEYAQKILPETAERIQTFIAIFETQWFTENKTIGFEVHNIRLGGLIQNVRAAAARLNGYIGGECEDGIEELCYPLLPYTPKADGSPKEQLELNNWIRMSTASII